MGLLETSIKEIVTTKYAKYIYLIIIVIIATVSIPKYFVTVSVFAGSMEKVQKQIMVGDLIQERQWLAARNTSLEREYDWYCHQSVITEEQRRTMRNIEEEITTNKKRIIEIDNKVRGQW